MSCKESVESTLLENKDGSSSFDSAGNPSSTSVTVIAEEVSQIPNSCRNNDSVQITEDSVHTSSVVNGRKPLIYEKMNGFTHTSTSMRNHETVVNGEALLTSYGDYDDAKSNPKAFISSEGKMNSEGVCSIPAKTDNLSTIHLTGQNVSECVETIDNHSELEGHSVEELIDKLASTPISLKEDSESEQLSLVKSEDTIDGINYVIYESERQMPDIMRLITKDLSEPYSIYTYRYFIHNWPKLCFLAMDKENCVGAIVCKLDVHKKMVRRGYIAMLAVDSEYRRRRIGSTLVTKAIHAMIRDDCDEVVLETEITNQAALHLYENLGFVRDKRLFRYYLNGVDALRLKLWLR